MRQCGGAGSSSYIMVWGVPTSVPAPWTPAALLDGQLGDWWSTSDLSKLKQDSTELTAVSADSDPVGSWRGAVNDTQLLQATAASRPTYSSAGVLFDGVDDVLMTAASVSFSGYPFSLAMLFDQSVNGAAGGAIVALSATAGDYVGITINTPLGSRATDRAAANVSTAPLQSYPAASGLAAAFATYSSGAQTFRYNAGSVSTSTSANTHAASRVIFGAQRQNAGVASLFSAGRIQQVVIVNKVLTDTDRGDLMTYWGL